MKNVTDPQPSRVRLRLLSTTDIHGHVTAWDYFADRPTDAHGLARTASLIAAARAEVGGRNVVVVDCGDFLQGNPLGDLVAEDPGRFEAAAHPVIAAMNVAGIEVSTLGNHDFNFGLEFLDRSLTQARFPVVSANVTRGAHAESPLDDHHLVQPFTLLDREFVDEKGGTQRLTLGFLGLCPPQIMGWDHRILAGRVDARDMRETAEAWVPELRARGAHLVILLAHCGIDPAPYRDRMEQAALHLAALPGVDAVVCGHQHHVLPGPDFAATPGVDAAAGAINGVPAVMAGAFGSHLGVLDLDLERDAAGWRVAGHRAAARPIAETGPDGTPRPLVEDAPPVRDAVAEAHQATLAHVRSPIGTTPSPVHTYFSLVADCPALQVVCDAQRLHFADRLHGTEWEGVPILSVTSPFKAGGKGGPDYYSAIAAGPVLVRDVADLYLYPNAATALLMSGAEVAEWLERSAAIFRQVAPGDQDADLIAAGHHTYNFDVIDGLRYSIDLGVPSRYDAEGRRTESDARRVRDITHEGRPVAPGDRFVVATNSYRAGGGGGFPGVEAAPRVYESADSSRDILFAHVRSLGGLRPRQNPIWRFRPMPDTTVVFESSPAAEAHLDAVADLAIEPAGPGSGGFARYRIRL